MVPLLSESVNLKLAPRNLKEVSPLANQNIVALH